MIDEGELEVAPVVLEQPQRFQQVARALVPVLRVAHVEDQAGLPLNVRQRPEALGIDAVVDDVHPLRVEVERLLHGFF